MPHQELYSVLFTIGSFNILSYFFALAITVYRFRKINSTVLCIGIVFMFQSLMLVIRDPLLALDSREAWYSTWVVINGFIVYALYKSHKVLEVNLAQITNRVALLHLMMVFVQIARYMEREYLGGEFLDAWYYIAVQAINISLSLVVLVTAIKDKKEKMVGIYV